MRYKELKIVEQQLFEYNRGITANKMGGKLLDAIKNDKKFADIVKQENDSQKINSVLEKLEKIDPTPTKTYVQWLAKQYINQQFYIEDGSQITEIIKDFISTPVKRDFKRRGLTTDINQYDYNMLRNEVIQSGRGGIDADTTSSAPNLDYDNIDQMRILYQGPQGQLIIPRSEDASCELGRGTDWCTAYDGDFRQKNQYEKYSKSGNLYVWVDGETGKKYQFHFPSSQYMDEDNQPIASKPMKELIASRSVLKKFFEKNANAEFKIKYIKPQPEEVQLEAVKVDGMNIRFILSTGEIPSLDVQRAAVTENPMAIGYIEDPEEEVKIAALASIAGVTDYSKMDFDELHTRALSMDVRQAISVQRPRDGVITRAAKKSASVIEDVLDFGITPSEPALIAAVSNNGSYIRDLFRLDLDVTERVQIAAVQDDYTALRDIIIVGERPRESVQLAAVKTDPRAIEYLLEVGINPSEDVQLAAVSNDSADPRFLKSIIQDMKEYDIPISDEVMRVAKQTITKYD